MSEADRGPGLAGPTQAEQPPDARTAPNPVRADPTTVSRPPSPINGSDPYGEQQFAALAGARRSLGTAPGQQGAGANGYGVAPVNGERPAPNGASPSDAVPSQQSAAGASRNGATAAEPKPSLRERWAALAQKGSGNDAARDQAGGEGRQAASPTSRPDVPVPAAAPAGAAAGGGQAVDHRAVGQPAAQPANSVAAPPAPPQPARETASAVTGPNTAVTPAVPLGEGRPVPPAVIHTPPPPRPRAGAARRTRKARLRLSRLDPWSVMKTSFLFSIAAGIMLVVAVYVVWTVIGSSGLFDSLNEIVKSVVATPNDTTPFRVQEYVNTQKVLGVTALLACVDVIIFTALATLGSFLYNLAATMLGGLEITLAED